MTENVVAFNNNSSINDGSLECQYVRLCFRGIIELERTYKFGGRVFISWTTFTTSFIIARMTKRLQAIGNSAGIIIDRPILDMLGITSDTELDLKTDGRSLIITPVDDSGRGAKLKKIQARTLKNHSQTFRKLAK